MSTCHLCLRDIRLLVLHTHATSCSGVSEKGPCVRWCQWRLLEHHAAKRTLHPTNSLTNSTGRHKVQCTRAFMSGSGVCYLQQLPLGLCLPLYSVLPARFSTGVCVYFRAQLCVLAGRIACAVVQMCIDASKHLYWSILQCQHKNTHQTIDHILTAMQFTILTPLRLASVNVP